MAESTIGSSTKGEVLVDFLNRSKKPTKKSMVGAGMASGTTNRGMTSGTSMDNGRDDNYFLGYGFDAAVRVGVDKARNAFINRIKNLDAGKKEVLIKRFDGEIANQKSLRKDTGLGAGMSKSYRDAAETKTPMSLDYATRARNAAAIKNLPSTISKAIKNAPRSSEESYMGDLGL